MQCNNFRIVSPHFGYSPDGITLLSFNKILLAWCQLPFMHQVFVLFQLAFVQRLASFVITAYLCRLWCNFKKNIYHNQLRSRKAMGLEISENLVLGQGFFIKFYPNRSDPTQSHGFGNIRGFSAWTRILYYDLPKQISSYPNRSDPMP